MRAVLEPHVGKNILMNVEGNKFREVSLYSVQDGCFSVGYPDTGYFYTYPYARIMVVTRPPKNREIEVKWGSSTYPLMVEVEHVVYGK